MGRNNGALTLANEPHVSMRLVLPTVFAAAFAILLICRWRALSTPFFWDEVGYYVPTSLAIWRNHFVPAAGAGVAQSYPPLFPLVFATAWSLAGFSIAVTRIVGFLLAAGSIAATFALARRVADVWVGIGAAACSLAAPGFWGQANLMQPEILVALLVCLSTTTLVGGKNLTHGVAVALLLMAKWSTAAFLPAFAVFSFATAPTRRAGLARQAIYFPGLAILAAWLIYFYVHTGTLTSTDPDYVRSNLWNNLEPSTLALRFLVRVRQAFFDDAAWLLSAPVIVVWALSIRRRDSLTTPDRERQGLLLRSRAQLDLLCGLVASYVLFLTVGGLLLPRYLVPIWPLCAVLGVASVSKLVRPLLATVHLAVTVLTMQLYWLGAIPTGYTPTLESRAEYVSFVDAHAQAARFLESGRHDARIFATWPFVGELGRPEFGYVSSPVATIPLADALSGAEPPGPTDVIVDAPIHDEESPAKELASRLGLIEVARFESGSHIVRVWGRIKSVTPPGQVDAPRTLSEKAPARAGEDQSGEVRRDTLKSGKASTPGPQFSENELRGHSYCDRSIRGAVPVGRVGEFVTR